MRNRVFCKIYHFLFIWLAFFSLWQVNYMIIIWINTELNKAVIYFTYQCWLFPTIKKGSWIELLLASSTSIKPLKRSECWRLYAVPTARFIFTAKKSLDVFSISWEQVWTFSVLGDRIYEMRCPFVALGLNACFIVLPHWNNMSQAHMQIHPVTLH